MLSYCLKCRKNTESKNLKVAKTKNGRMMFLSKCAVCDSKKSKFMKQQEVSGLLGSLGINILLNKIPLLCFQHDMAYVDFKDLTRRASSDKTLRDKAFIIVKNPKYHGYQRGLVSMV